MKFIFNLQTETLKIIQGDRCLVLPADWKFSYFGGIGYHLSELGQGWIIFTVHQEKVKVIYKTFQEWNEVESAEQDSAIYYHREIFRPPGGVIEIEFCGWDRIKKI